MKLQQYFRPMRFRMLSEHAPNKPSVRILDVGCGNSSCTLTKRWLPDCQYHGVDIQHYNQTDADWASMDRFFLVGTERQGYEAIPDDYYDVIVMNHVIEHSREPFELLRTVIAKLSRGGVIFLAFPSQKSLRLPPAQIGTLNFSDDPTHIWLPDFVGIVNTMSASNVRVVRGGRSKDLLRYLLGLAFWPVSMARKVLTGKLDARGLWYLYGFEDFVLGIKQ